MTHQNNFIRSLQPSIYPKHHKYGRHSLAHSKSYHSPRVCHFYVLYPHFAIVSQPTPSNTLTTWHHPQISSTIHPPYPKRLVKVPSSCRCSSLRAPPSAVLRRQAWQPQRKFRRDKRPRRASEGLVEWHNVRPPQKVPTGEMPNLGKFTRGMEHLVYIYIYKYSNCRNVWKWRSLLKKGHIIHIGIFKRYEKNVCVGSRCVLHKFWKLWKWFP